MRYWDSSALVPLLVSEPSSERARAWLKEDGLITTWAWTRVEITSAIERRVREGSIDRTQRRELLRRVDLLSQGWDEVVDVLSVRQRALQLVARHPLRAADAAQLAAALVVAGDEGLPLTFVCLDERLALAAEREGLNVLA